MTLNDIGFAAFALGRNVVYLSVGVPILLVVTWLMFWYMNRSLGITFKDHAWDIIKTDAKAVSLYFGLRVLGVLIAGGLVASAFLK